jgi:hypothetical protein
VTHCVQKLFVLQKRYIYAYGCDKSLARYDIQTGLFEQTGFEENIRTMKKFKSHDDEFRILVSLENGVFRMLDTDLRALKTVIGPHPNEKVIALANISKDEILSFTKDGQIDVFMNSDLKHSRDGSIFNIKSEDYIGIALIKSKEYVLFTLERQKMEFVSINNKGTKE